MPGLSDAELRWRLEAHNYAVTPITDGTGRLLIKKLAQLDGDNKKACKAKSIKPPLVAYSYVDEEYSLSIKSEADETDEEGGEEESDEGKKKEEFDEEDLEDDEEELGSEEHSFDE